MYKQTRAPGGEVSAAAKISRCATVKSNKRTDVGTHLVGDGVDLNGNVALSNFFLQQGMLVERVAVSDASRVQQQGVHQVVVCGRLLPV